MNNPKPYISPIWLMSGLFEINYLVEQQKHTRILAFVFLVVIAFSIHYGKKREKKTKQSLTLLPISPNNKNHFKNTGF